jgi:hypothetical protein
MIFPHIFFRGVAQPPSSLGMDPLGFRAEKKRLRPAFPGDLDRKIGIDKVR